MYLGTIRPGPPTGAMFHPQQQFKPEKYNATSIYNCKNSIKLIYIIFIYCTNKQITELNW